MPITDCTRPLNTTAIKAGKRLKRGTSCTKSASIAGRRTTGGGTKIGVVGTISETGMIAITIKTIGRMIEMTTGGDVAGPCQVNSSVMARA